MNPSTTPHSPSPSPTQPLPIPLCTACSPLNLSLSAFLSDPYTEGKVHQLGSFPELSERTTSCRLCELLVQTCDSDLWRQVSPEKEQVYFSAAWADANYTGEQSGGQKEEVRSKAAILMVYIKQQYEAGGLSLAIRPLPCSPIIQGSEDTTTDCLEEEYQHFARQVESELMDFSLVKEWLNGCETHHSCSTTFTSLTGPYRTPAAFRCIDVQEMRIVQPPSKCRYLTLSYVWGAGAKFVALQENIQQLSQPGGLNSCLDRLSSTIRDAIEVTRRLGEKYIWIDSLCMVQDAGEEKLAALQDMGLVYSQALLMLCAADDRCLADGLRGVRVPRRVKQYTQEMAPGFTLTAQFGYDVFLELSVYNNRGWTYQEEQFSSRMLLFINDQLFFRCQQSVCSETTHSMSASCSDPTTLLPATKRRLIGREGTSISMMYFRAVETYLRRMLTYSSDIINALAGVLTTQGRMMDCEIFHGLPVAIFDMAMLWQPSGVAEIRRREGFPSWSWAGWEGKVAWRGDTMEMGSYGLYESSEELERKMITGWVRERTWIDWRKWDGKRLVPVWVPRPRDENRKGGTLGYAVDVSSADNLYGRSEDLKPLLLAENRRQDVKITSRSEQYLYFSTVSIQFRIRPSHAYLRYGSIDPPFNPTHQTIFHLFNRHNHLSGYILLPHTFTTQHTFPAVPTQFSLSGSGTEPLYEFLLLSKANYYSNWGRPHDGHAYRISYAEEDYIDIHVMMVTTRADGVKERVGLGRIHEDAVADGWGEGAVWRDVVLG
ncbi:heterokaryon incompatibility protein [Rutstroemia sp. NJR-2017a BVV2]|nr:heterokaryon incompatibility protein [Rutstroemia sp. NJR-2017a BVV2]